MNPAFCAMVGFAREELVGVGMPHPFWPPEERASISRDLDAGHAGDHEQRGGDVHAQGRRTLPGADHVPAHPRRGRPPVCVFATIKDISEQRRAEAACARAKATTARSSRTHRSARRSRHRGLLVYGNGALAAIFGYDSPRELMAEVDRASLGEVLYADPADRLEFVRRVHAAGDAWTTFESRMRRKDGAVIGPSCTSANGRRPNSAETYFYGFVQDVTEQRRSTKALEKIRRTVEPRREPGSPGQLGMGPGDRRIHRFPGVATNPRRGGRHPVGRRDRPHLSRRRSRGDADRARRGREREVLRGRPPDRASRHRRDPLPDDLRGTRLRRGRSPRDDHRRLPRRHRPSTGRREPARARGALAGRAQRYRRRAWGRRSRCAIPTPRATSAAWPSSSACSPSA